MKPCHYNKHFYGLQGNIEEKNTFCNFFEILKIVPEKYKIKKIIKLITI